MDIKQYLGNRSRTWWLWRILAVLIVLAGIFFSLYWMSSSEEVDIKKVANQLNHPEPPFKKQGDAIKEKVETILTDPKDDLIKRLQKENAQLRADTAALHSELRQLQQKKVAVEVPIDSAEISPALKAYIEKEIAKVQPAKTVTAKKRLHKESCNCPSTPSYYGGNQRRVY